MKRFSIPGYYSHFRECYELIEYRKQHPDHFYEDRIIDSSYDLPSGLIWNGGRIDFGNGYNPIQIHDVMMYYLNETSINLNHTCTNLLIDEGLARDWYCNLFLSQYFRPQDKIIISSQELLDYLLGIYQKDQFIYSTTLCIDDLEKVNELTENNIYVVNYRRNNDDKYLKQLKHPENIELICAEPCHYECKQRQKHYEELSSEQLGLLDFENGPKIKCYYDSENKLFDVIQQLPHAVNNNRIDQLSQLGINYFKISGRTIPTPQWIQTVTYYLVKPEWLEHVRFDLLNKLW